MSIIRAIKTYDDATLSGTPVIVKFDNVPYCYAKFYPTISAAAGESQDSFADTMAGYADSTLSGVSIAIQITSNNRPHYIRGYETIGTETLVYAGVTPAASSHDMSYVYGATRVGMITINGAPYYAKMYPYQVSSAIYDMGSIDGDYDEDYISLIYAPIAGNFPVMTSSGELQTSEYNVVDFDSAGTGHTEATAHVAAHQSTYNHAHYDTAYGWGNHASLYSLLSHVHSGVYDPAGTGNTEATAHVATHESTYSHANYDTAYGWGNHASLYSLLAHVHTGTYAAYSHDHSGVYDQAGTGHTEAAAHVTSHESSYTHSNIANGQTAYGWGNHATAGYSASGHLHTGVYAASSHVHTGTYDPAGTGHTEAAAHVATHESDYNHSQIANGQTSYGWGNHASAGYSLTSHLHKGVYSEVDHTHETLSHNHNDIYYTESEIATYLAGKASTTHNHTGVYSASGHTHTGVYATAAHTHSTMVPAAPLVFPMYTSVSSSGDIADTTAVSIVTAGTYHITAHMTGYCNSYVACSIRVGGNVFNSATQIAYGAQSCSVYGSVTVSVTRALSVGEYIWMGRFAVGTSGTRTVYGDDVLLGGTYYCFHRIV